ncbi:Uncharacterised protein [uncultured archaeon]|nr:Uncharacterised protein [uncultured archaeon]
MKINYKKVATVLGSALMLGSTAAFAAAASFTPSSFTDGGVALVVGQKAASSDLKAAIDLTANLAPATATAATTATVTGGDSVKIERASQKFNLNQGAATVMGIALSKDELTNLLADQVFKGKDNKEYNYQQTIDLSDNLNFTHFSDNGYKSDTPALGFFLNSGDEVMTYSLSFNTAPNNSTIKDKEITMMGKPYYILDYDANKIVLLDSASSATATDADGGAVTLTAGGKSYEVSISSVYTSSNEDVAKLVINGETTEALAKGDTYKLSDGGYIGVKEVIKATREKDANKVEFSIGTGKIELRDGQNVKSNDKNTERNLVANVDLGTTLNSFGFTWKVDKDTFVTPEQGNLTVPLFGNVNLQMADITMPAQEVTKVNVDGREKIKLEAPIKDGAMSLDLYYINQSNGTILGLGKDANNVLVTSTDTNLVYNESAKNKWFVVSWNSSSEAETYLLSATTGFDSNDADSVTITNEITGNDICTDVIAGRTCKVGNTVLTVSDVNATSTNRWVNLTADSTKTNFSTVYTPKGMKITLPTTDIVDTDNFALVFNEANEDGKIAQGGSFTATTKVSSIDSENKTDVSAVSVPTLRIQDSDDYEGYVSSKLATKVVLNDPSAAQGSATVTYHGGEVYANVFVTAPGATVTSGTSASSVGVMTVYDNEVSSASGKNLVVIGGSCVNTVAAELLGGALCGDAFTAATGIKSGEALIESFARSGKTALLVAGFNAEDTTKAITYLSNNNVNATVGSKLKVTSATTATAITA